MVKAKVIKDGSGRHRILAQRAKYKHWFLLGQHKATDREFSKALLNSLIVWEPTITITDNLFER